MIPITQTPAPVQSKCLGTRSQHWPKEELCWQMTSTRAQHRVVHRGAASSSCFLLALASAEVAGPEHQWKGNTAILRSPDKWPSRRVTAALWWLVTSCLVVPSRSHGLCWGDCSRIWGHCWIVSFVDITTCEAGVLHCYNPLMSIAHSLYSLCLGWSILGRSPSCPL